MTEPERYFGFFAPGRRKHLAVLRQQLELTYPICANETDAAHHEPLWFPTPSFFLDAGFSPGTQASIRLSPGTILVNHVRAQSQQFSL
jgi:hypothetical protein